MKNTLNNLMVLVILIALTSCNDSGKESTATVNKEQYTEIEKANWLIGAWQNKSPHGIMTEVWDVKNDSIFSGESYFVINNDTVSFETISLKQEGNQLYYIPTVSDQNDAQPTTFTLTSSTPKTLVFENPSHDFPQKIAYELITNDSLVAEISGTIEGGQRAQQFPMTRVK